jgi:DNA-binding IclR family transcriptional regulator
LAAFGGMSEKQIRQNFDKVKWVRPIDYQVWRSQVDQVIKDGYAEDKEGFVQGVSTLSVPVYNRDQTVSHTIGIFAINSQLESANHKKILEALWEVADYIHQNLRN